MSAVRNYILVTLAYWAFTLTDGALRMLVLLHFHGLGYSPVDLAFLFLFYEFFGVVTNLLGGYIAARLGLRVTLFSGLVLQVLALGMLSLLERRLVEGRVRGLRHGRPGALWHRQGPDQDELQELHQGAGPRGPELVALQVGGRAHRLEERAQGRRLLLGRAAALPAGLP
jgi:hypothetical protein